MDISVKLRVYVLLSFYFFCLLFFPVPCRCHNKVYCDVHAGDVCSLSVYAVS